MAKPEGPLENQNWVSPLGAPCALRREFLTFPQES